MTRQVNRLKVVSSFNPRVRYEWRAKDVYDDDVRIICTESPPTMRSIFIDSRVYHLAFPRSYYFLIFCNREFLYISLFYGKGTLTKRSKLYLPCLSNIGNSPPYEACFDPIKLRRPAGWHKIIEEFWASEFVWDDSNALVEMYNTRGEHRFILDDWEVMSKSNPNKIFNFPWLPAKFENGRSDIAGYLRSCASNFEIDSETIKPATRQRKRSG